MNKRIKEAKSLLRNIRTFEQAQETTVLLMILALGQQQIGNGQVTPLRDALKQAKSRR